MNKIRRVPVISHTQIRQHFSGLKNFDAWIAFLRRIKILPRSIRKGNISSLKRGNIGVHPGPVIEFLEKILEFRKQGKGYKQIKEELRKYIEEIRAMYSSKNIALNDPRCRPEELIGTYNAVLPVLEKYYGWGPDSFYSKFYRHIPSELRQLRNLYFNTVMAIEIKDDGDKDHELLKEREDHGKQLDACFDIVYFIIRQYEKLRNQRKEIIDMKLSSKEL